MSGTAPDRRPTGRNAASVKYDILSALGVHACAGDKHLQRLVLRLITLIVARYNWIADELAVGQREMAEMWSIDERSVKREVARMRDLGWLVVKRPAARGRVAVHGLDIGSILASTRPSWPRIGSDFVQRLSGPETPPPIASNVISFPAPRGDDGLWPRLQAQLFRDEPNLYGAWFAGLRCEGVTEGVLHLIAPSRFHADYVRSSFLHRLERLAQAGDASVLRVEISA